nr:retrotransposon-related protein [Tanacetum cinerariifolium]
PLTQLLKKRAYTLNSEAQSAFEALKQAMICALVLKLPNFAKKFIIKTDASGGEIRAVLLQEGHPIAFLSNYTWHSQQLRRKGKLMVENDEALRKELLQQMYDRRTTKQWLKWLTLTESWSNTNFHTSIHTTPYEAVYGKAPPIHIPYIGGESKVDLVDKTLSESEADVETFKFHISRAQSRMKSHDDKGRTDKQFDCGDWVFLKLQPYRQVSLRKATETSFHQSSLGHSKSYKRLENWHTS